MEIPKSQSLSKSPIVTKPIDTMAFPEAIKEVIEGRKITKLEWEDKGYYGFLNRDVLSLHKPDGKNYQWIVSEGDLLGKDWMVVS